LFAAASPPAAEHASAHPVTGVARGSLRFLARSAVERDGALGIQLPVVQPDLAALRRAGRPRRRNGRGDVATAVFAAHDARRPGSCQAISARAVRNGPVPEDATPARLSSPPGRSPTAAEFSRSAGHRKTALRLQTKRFPEAKQSQFERSKLRNHP
jgi:hypothetical protein